VGLAAIRFAAVFPEAQINCYEPDPDNFQLLKLNTQDIPNIQLHHEAIGSTVGKGSFYVNLERHTASSLNPSKGSGHKVLECSIKSLDAVIEEVGTNIDLIKFDIEGVEYEVFSCSQLVHDTNYLVGEIKGSHAEIDRFVGLFPSHYAEVTQAAKHMYYIYLRHKRC
jgi:FkbM family methyltransferase